MVSGTTAIPQNAVLRSLCPDDFWTLRPYLRRVSFNQHAIIQEHSKLITHVDFIEAGLVSLRAIADGSVIETAIVGRQGISGASIVLGGRHAAHQSRALIAGSALRIEVDDLLRSMEKRPTIRNGMLSYVEALMIHGAQLALCGVRHSIEERVAFWMCLASDAINCSTLPITHERISINLGVRRAGITEALSRFQTEGVIRKMRGALEIAERGRLEASACCCYRVVAASYRSRPRAEPSRSNVENDMALGR